MSIPTHFRMDGWVKSATGAAVPGAQIYICTQPANLTVPPTPLASIYSDPLGVVPITQPIITDGFGHYDFYALPETYTVIVALSNVIQQVYVDQTLGVAGTAPSTSLLLETNGSSNGDQSLLNLQQGSGITLVDNGSGQVTITNTNPTPGTPLVLETNSVANGSQALLNLKNGSNITITDDGVGGITIAGSGGASVVQTATLNVLAADIVSGGNYVQMIAAPGANKFIYPLSALARYRHGTVGFANLKVDLYIGPGDLQFFGTGTGMGSIGASTSADGLGIPALSMTGNGLGVVFSTEQNLPFYVHVWSSTSSGNGSVTVEVSYVIMDLT